MSNLVAARNLDSYRVQEKRLSDSQYMGLIGLAQGHLVGNHDDFGHFFVYHFFTPLFFPKNTRTLSNFSFSLLIPTSELALHIKSPVFTIITLIPAIFLDVATLPIRLVTAIPTVIRDRILAWRQKNYLISLGFNPELFEGRWSVSGLDPNKQDSLTAGFSEASPYGNEDL